MSSSGRPSRVSSSAQVLSSSFIAAPVNPASPSHPSPSHGFSRGPPPVLSRAAPGMVPRSLALGGAAWRDGYAGDPEETRARDALAPSAASVDAYPAPPDAHSLVAGRPALPRLLHSGWASDVPRVLPRRAGSRAAQVRAGRRGRAGAERAGGGRRRAQMICG